MKIWGAVSTAHVPIEHTQQSETDAKIDWKEINYGTYLMITFMTCEFLFETDKIKRKLNFSVGEAFAVRSHVHVVKALTKVQTKNQTSSSTKWLHIRIWWMLLRWTIVAHF